MATLKYTEGSYEESEENTRNMRMQVCKGEIKLFGNYNNSTGPIYDNIFTLNTYFKIIGPSYQISIEQY